MFRIVSLLFSLMMGWGLNVSVTPNNQSASVEVKNTAVGAEAVAPKTEIGTESTVPPASGSVEQIAQCLSEKGAKFYGAFWCPHCDEQKKMFGDAMKYIQYIECDQRGENSQWQLCDEAEIQAYPTWIFGSGERAVGAYKPEDLAEKAGCTI